MTAEEIKKVEETIVENLKNGRENDYDPNNRTLGGGGIPKGMKVTLTGKVLFEKNEDNPTFSYYYLATKEGVKISVTSIAGISSFAGYEFCTTEELPTGKTFKDAKDRIVTATMLATDCENVNFFAERNLVKLISWLMQHEEDLKEQEVEFLGVCVKQITLRKATTLGDKKYKKGDVTYISTKCWSKVEI